MGLFSCSVLFVVLSCLVDAAWHCDNLGGEERADLVLFFGVWLAYCMACFDCSFWCYWQAMFSDRGSSWTDSILFT